MKDSRRRSRTPRSAEKAQPETSSRRSRKSLERDSAKMTRKRSLSNKSRSPPPKKSNSPLEGISHRPVNPNIPPLKFIDGKLTDSFCWVCHDLTEESICPTCPRVYHTECLKKLRKGSSDSLTCECCYTTVDGKLDGNIWFPNDLKPLLKHVVEEAYKDSKKNSQKKQQPENSKFLKLFKTWPEMSVNDQLCQIADYDVILDKINDLLPFKNTGQFYTFVKWIHHNCCIVYGADSEIAHAALQLEKNFKLELTDIEACRECYSRMYNSNCLHPEFFTELCEEPHEVVWAKLRGSPFWPAKVARIYENGHVDVRFFGTHDKSIMPPSQLLKFSSEHPAKKEVSKSKFIDAMDEVSLYISNYKQVYGKFRYYPKNTPFSEKTKSPVKRNKRRSRSRAHQSEDASNDNDLCGSPTNQMINPSLNISFLHDEQTDIKMNPILPSTPLSSGSSIREPSVMRNDAESGENFPERRSDLILQMVFSEENNTVELNTSDEFIGDNPQSSTPENPEDQHIPLSSIASPTGAFVNENNSNFTSATTNGLPVITTASSCSTNESTNGVSPQNSVCSSNITSRVHAEYMPENILTAAENAILNSCLNEARIPDDDEIMFISESSGNKTQVDAISKTPSKVNAVCELLLLSRPSSKKRLADFLQLAKDYFVKMLLDASSRHFDLNDIKAFQIIYEKCLRKIGELSKEANTFKIENINLKKKIYALKKDAKDMQSKINLADLLKDQLLKNAVDSERREIMMEFDEKKKQYIEEHEERLKEQKKNEQILTEQVSCLKAQIASYEQRQKSRRLIDAECQTDIFKNLSNNTNSASSNISSDTIPMNEQNFQQLLQYQRSISLYPPPPGSGLTGTFIGETNKFLTLEQGFNPMVPLSSVPTIPMMTSNLLPVSSSTFIRSTMPTFQPRPNFNQTPKSKVPAIDYRTSPKTSKRRNK